MAEPILLDPAGDPAGARVVVPTSALEVTAVRSSGPGGQNVNKVSSKVELRVDLAAVTGLDLAARARLEKLAARRLAADGRLLVTSQRTRDRERNLADAREKVRALIAAALVAPVPRKPTKPSRAQSARRLADKRRTGAQKATRRGGPSSEEE
jgi:ribosome-associated protein